MPILSLPFQNDRDIHVLAGQTSVNLLQADRLVVTRRKPDGTTESIWASANTDPNEVITFTPVFKNTVTTVGSTKFCDGFGIRVYQKTGEVTVTKPLLAVRKYNFLLEREGENTSLPADDKGRKVSAFIRVQVHQSVSKVWLTSFSLTVHRNKSLQNS